MRGKMGKLVAFLLLASVLSVPAIGAEWEYKVIYLPPTIKKNMSGYTGLKKLPDGSYLDTAKTKALNYWATRGWQVIAVTGPALNHIVYLRRIKK